MYAHYHSLVYAFGPDARAEAAARNLRALCAGVDPQRIVIERVDLADDMDRAIREGIFASPTVERRLPGAVRRVIGDLSDAIVARRKLDLHLEPEEIPA